MIGSIAWKLESVLLGVGVTAQHRSILEDPASLVVTFIYAMRAQWAKHTPLATACSRFEQVATLLACNGVADAGQRTDQHQ